MVAGALGLAPPASAGLLSSTPTSTSTPTSPVPPTSTSGTTLVNATATVLGNDTSTAVVLPDDPPDDVGVVGTIADAVCDVSDGLDGDSGTLAETACLLKAAEIKVVTEFGPAGTTPLRRETTGLVGVPIAVDADNVTGPDLTVTATLDSEGRAVLRIERLVAAPFPVSVEAFVADPSPGVDRRFGGGYSGRESTAPRDFEATVLPASRPEIDIEVTEPGPNLTILGELFEVAPDGTPVDPTRAAARVAPVPATLHAEFETTTAPSGAETTDADLSVSAPTRLDLDLDITTTEGDPPVTTTAATDAFAQLTDTLGATITTTPVADTIPAGEERVQVRVERGGPITAAGVTQRELVDGATLSTTQAELTGLPAVIEADVQPQTATSPLTIDAVPSGPITTSRVAVAELREPIAGGNDPAILRESDGTASATTVRIDGLRHAHVELAAPDLLVDASIASQPLEVEIEDPDLKVKATVADLPEELDLDLRPDAGEVHYDGSAEIANLDLTLGKPSGLRTSERTGVVADELMLDLAGIPLSVDADLVPAQGEPVAVEVGPEPITTAVVHLTDTAADGLELPADGDDAAIVHDLLDRNAVLLRLSEVLGADLRSTGDDIDVSLRTGEGTPELQVAVRQRPESRTGPDEEIDATVTGRPACMRVALTAIAPEPVCGTSQDPPPPAVPDQTHIRWEGATAVIDAEARNLEALDRRDLFVDLVGVEDRLDAEIVAPPEGLQRVAASSTGGALDLAKIRLTDGPTDDALPDGHQGVLVRDHAVLGLVTGLTSLTAQITPDFDVELRSGSGDPIKVDLHTTSEGEPDARVDATITGPPDCLRFAAGDAVPGAACGAPASQAASAGATNVVLQGSARFGAVAAPEIRGLDGLPAGRTLHVTLTGVPALLGAGLTQDSAGSLQRIRAEAPGNLETGEIEFEGGLPRDELLDNGDGVVVHESPGGTNLRALVRISDFLEADVTPSPLDVSLRRSVSGDMRLNILRQGAGPAGVDQVVTGTLADLPQCLRLQAGAPVPGAACGRLHQPSTFFADGTNIGYLASGVPAGGSRIDVDLAGLPGLDSRGKVDVLLTGVPDRAGVGLQPGTVERLQCTPPPVISCDLVEVQEGLARIRARADELGSAFVGLDVGDPGPGSLPADRDGVHLRLNADGVLRAQTRVTGLRRADVSVDPLSVLLSSGGDTPAKVFFRDRRTPDSRLSVDVDVDDKPDCISFELHRDDGPFFVVPPGQVPCGHSARPARFGNATNVQYLADEDVPNVDVTLRGLPGFRAGDRLDMEFDDVPGSVGASINEDSEGLARIRASAPDENPLGRGRVALEAGIDVDDVLTTGDGAFVRRAGDDTGLAAAVSGFQEADVSLRPVDVLLRSDADEPATVDVDLDDPRVVVDNTTVSDVPPCLRFTVQDRPMDARCGGSVPAGVLRDDHQNVLIEAVGAPAPVDAHTDLVTLPGLDGRSVGLDLRDVPERVAAAVAAAGGTEDLGTVRFGDSSFGTDYDIEQTQDVLSLHVGASDPLGRGELRLGPTGGLADIADFAAGRDDDGDGLEDDGFRLVDKKTRDDDGFEAHELISVFARVHGFRGFDLDRDSITATAVAEEAPPPGAGISGLLTRNDAEHVASFRTSSTRHFLGRVTVQQDGENGEATVELDDLPGTVDVEVDSQSGIDLPGSIGDQLPADLSDRLDGAAFQDQYDVEYDASAEIQDAHVLLEHLTGERTEVTVEDIPGDDPDETDLDVCIVMDDQNDTRDCGIDLVEVNTEADEELELSARLRMESPVTIVEVDHCGESGSDLPEGDPEDCLLEDGPRGSSGTEAMYIDDATFEDLDFQMAKGRKEKGVDPDNNDFLAVIGLRTPRRDPDVPDSRPPLEIGLVEVIDLSAGDFEPFFIVGGIGPGTTAAGRVVGLDTSVLSLEFDLVDSHPSWAEGSLNCGEGTGLQAMVSVPLLGDLTARLHPSLCTNDDGESGP